MRVRATAVASLGLAALAGIVATGQAPAGGPGGSAGVDYTRLSGAWRGRATQLQRGKCPASRFTPGYGGYEIRGDLAFASDGTLSATFVTAPTFKPVPGGDGTNNSWTGRIAADGAIQVSRPSRAECRAANGTSYAYTYSIDYEGTLKVTKKGYEIEVAGLDTPCPEFECSFKRVITLTRKAP